MKKNFLFVVLLTTVVFFFSPVFSNAETKLLSREKNGNVQDWMPCVVADPTGTPLNVRAKANGKIIATVKNGTIVAIDDSTAGNKWSRISFTRGKKSIIGWVLREYLSCQ
ncbi:MAG: SH3 domain-containing protein [Acidobacteriota bacterium]|nr:SH3 domain-containing protein [Acidobacteriota bacterium]